MLELTEQEKKLLCLGLDPAAQPGEIQGGAVKFFQSLRKRRVTDDQIESSLTGSNGAAAPPNRSVADWGLTRLPFGKHKGEMFMDIPPMDLRSTYRWINETADKAEKFKDLAFSIDQFLKQTRHV
jgi:hypothetical protein